MARKQQHVVLGIIAAADAKVERVDEARERERRMWDAVSRRAARDRATQLDSLFAAGRITVNEHELGQTLQGLWRTIGLQPSMVAQLERSGGSGVAGGPIERMSISRLQALGVWRRIMALLSTEQKSELRRVVAMDEPCSDLPALRGAFARLADQVAIFGRFRH
jgi:hypothetical protein